MSSVFNSGRVSRHMYTLKKALSGGADSVYDEDSDGDPTLSKHVGYPVQAHHCISCSVISSMMDSDMGRLARQSGYDVNNGNNGVALPARFGHMRKHQKQRHSGGHWDNYYVHVEEALQPVYDAYKDADCKDEETRKNILGELKDIEDDIKSDLVERKLWLYDWSAKLYTGDYRDEGGNNMKSARDPETSSAAGLEWLGKYKKSDVKRRHEIKNGKNVLLEDWYEDRQYPVPGGLTAVE